MKLTQALRLDEAPVVAFVGAGGKTTAMFQLARELAPPVVVTATTHLGAWQIPLADEHIVAGNVSILEDFNPRGVTLVSGPIAGDRVVGAGMNVIHWLHEFCRLQNIPLLMEADGSRRKPLKAPAEREPPIPDFVQLVVVVAGLTGLGKLLNDEFIHRPEIFAQLSGLQRGEVVTPAALARVLTNPAGGLKNIPSNARRAILLNQADTPEMQAQAGELANRLLPTYNAVIAACLKNNAIYATHEPVAGIILAAGGSERFGRPKQTLDWRRKPFVYVVARTAIQAGLRPVIVVTGARAKEVAAALGNLDVHIVHNPDWQSGQASSIRAGLQHLGTNPGAAIFLLADQPQVTPPILHALVEEHAHTLKPVIAPLVIDRRGNPVLFDRITFPDLQALEGDVGGRGIFSRYRIHYLPWHDEALLLDVDKPEDYQHLKDLLE